ncbi:DUF3570 domain-containing protein [Aliikangiella marina]|uniref:DUF3570 domain-containing protein n=1 Tax=Aliikangiella marina TaxID=1712262 RepID=UPI001FEB0AD4|nr:DUF3570 domain-containing protein [Aliikangiella marina]
MAVTSRFSQSCKLAIAALFGGVFVCNQAFSAVLPEDRADALYHAYDGGGVTIQGPSILVRKSVGNNVSFSANYYVDNVQSASIDVVTRASEYTERREEKGFGVDFLHNKTTIGLNYTESQENDFFARSGHLTVSQDFFGDLTTLSLGYSQGQDEVGRRGDEDFKENAERRHFRLGLSQIITKNSILNFSLETITDEGYLNNPYRAVRYLDPTVGAGYAYQDERYPETRTSDSAAIRGLYYLPYRASVKFELKTFADTWGIEADSQEIGYVHPIGDNWQVDFKLRSYKQGQADFYSDLFPRIDAQNFLARDKEMSAFSSQTIGVGGYYKYELKNWDSFDRFSINLSLDRVLYQYDNFRDLRVSAEPGTEPLYEYEATVYRFYFSLFY